MTGTEPTEGTGTVIDPLPAAVVTPEKLKVMHAATMGDSRNWLEAKQADDGGGRQLAIPSAGTAEQAMQGQVLHKTTYETPATLDAFMVRFPGVVNSSGLHEDPPGVPPGVSQ